MMNSRLPFLPSLMIGALILGACQAPTLKTEDAAGARAEADAALAAFLERDPDIQRFIDSSVGYAIFPKLGKGGLIVGGGGGTGYVFEGTRLIGTAAMTQVSFGAQIGGQRFSEVIFFQGQQDLDSFKSGTYEFGAQVSAVAATSGAAREASFDNGLAVFTLADKGLMAEAAVSGQKFKFKPLQ